MFAALAAARFAHDAAVCLLFGLAAFPFYAGWEVRSRLRLTWPLLACSLLALITGGLELLAMAGTMGDSWRAAFDPDTLAAAVTDTGFGRVWIWRLLLATAIVPLCARTFPGRGPILLIASGVLLGSIALTGHAALPGDTVGAVHQVADGLHLLAAGWWTGGLLSLLLLGGGVGDALPRLLGRFSRIGYIAVSLILLSGLFSSVVLVSPASALLTTAYGRVLLAKIGLFGIMILLALSNRFRVTPALASGVDPMRWRRRLTRQVSVEIGLAMLVLLLVGALGAMSPPLSD